MENDHVAILRVYSDRCGRLYSRTDREDTQSRQSRMDDPYIRTTRTTRTTRVLYVYYTRSVYYVHADASTY